MGLSVLTEEEKVVLEKNLIAMSVQGQRVVAIGTLNNSGVSDSVSNLTFVGFLGMKDVWKFCSIVLYYITKARISEINCA